MIEIVAEEQLVDLANFTAELFEPCIGQVFVFERPTDSGGAAVEPARMMLLEVRRGVRSPALRREPFSLFFVMKDQAPLSEELHRLVHPGCEAADLLVTRVTAPKYQAMDPAGMYYEAVFG